MTTQLLDLFKLLVKPAGMVDAFRHFSPDWTPASDIAGSNCSITRYDDGSLLVTPTNNTLPMIIGMRLPLLSSHFYSGDYASLRIDTRYDTSKMNAAAAFVENVPNGVNYTPAQLAGSAPDPAGYTAQTNVFHRGVAAAGLGGRSLQIRVTFSRSGAGLMGNVKIMPDPTTIVGGAYICTKTELYVNPSQYMVETPVVAGATQNITGDTISIAATRGVTLKGAIDQIEPGVLKATVKGATYDPGLNEALRPGSAVWLVGRADPASADWACLFSGTVLNGDVTYEGAETKVVIEATDIVADLANTGAPQSWGRYDAATGADAGGNVRAATRVQRLVENYFPRLFYSIQDSDALTAGDSNPQLLDKDDSASFLDQLQRIRDTSRGVAWFSGGEVWIVSAGPPVVRDELRPPSLRLHFRAGNSLPSAVPRYLFTDNPAEAGLKYTDLKTSFSARALFNAAKLRVKQVNTDVTYGPYRNMDSFTRWGAQEDTVELHELVGWAGPLGAAPDAGLTAQNFLRRFAAPIRYPSHVIVNVTEDPTPALASELYDAAQVKRGAMDVTARVIRLTHTITANRKRPERGRWQLQLDMRPDWATAAVPVQPPNALTDPLAPGSPQGNTDPAAIQPYTRLSRRGVDYTFTFAAGNNGLGIPQTVIWDTTLENYGIAYDGGNRWWTIPKTGRYLIAGRVSMLIPAGSPASYLYTVALVNGVEKGRNYMYHPDNAVRTNEHTQVLRLVAGDHLQLGFGTLLAANYTLSSSSGTASPDDRTSCTVTYLGG